MRDFMEMLPNDQGQHAACRRRFEPIVALYPQRQAGLVCATQPVAWRLLVSSHVRGSQISSPQVQTSIFLGDFRDLLFGVRQESRLVGTPRFELGTPCTPFILTKQF
jgi:hypothetical protein